MTEHTADFKRTADFTDRSRRIQTQIKIGSLKYSRLLDELQGEGINRRLAGQDPQSLGVIRWGRRKGAGHGTKKSGYTTAPKSKRTTIAASQPLRISRFRLNRFAQQPQASLKFSALACEVLKQWHAALSANKSVQDADNLAWHTYADWLDAGKPTDRNSINDIILKKGSATRRKR